ncbi:hypothetical protein OG871_35135 [Kitasatospora sp. NBC_00374]|uniref:hypothetical protein n=1 Tax=Kitasatospora sp. NBC_00374 TaxID=2975964 RepID=UPI0030DFB1DB
MSSTKTGLAEPPACSHAPVSHGPVDFRPARAMARRPGHLYRWRVEIPHGPGMAESGPYGPGVHLFIVEAGEADHALAQALTRAQSADACRHRRHTPLTLDLDHVSVVRLSHVA